jgi:hypothetical protein
MFFFLGSIYYGVKIVDLAIEQFLVHQSILSKGATKITKSHFRQPEESVFNKGNFNLFLEKVTEHKEGILAWKPLYVVLLGLYLVIACLIIIKVICTDNSDKKGPPEIEA